MANSNSHPLDSLIINAAPAADQEWQSVTGVISAVFDDPAFDKNKYAAADIAERIYVLVDNGQLDSSGNMRRWRVGKIKRLANA